MAGVAVRESATFAGRPDQVREARAFVARLLGPSHPRGDVAILLASELADCFFLADRPHLAFGGLHAADDDLVAHGDVLQQ
jgi:hypothetical protein